MSVLWRCPRDEHTAVRGPERPWNDNLCRYCLACSKSAGKLIKRVAPSVEKKRALRTERQKHNAKVASVREKARGRAARSVGDLNLDAELKRFWELPSIREARTVKHGRGNQFDRVRLPELRIRRSKTKAHTSGNAYSGGPITITLDATHDQLEATLTLLHEVTHAALPSDVHHGPRFWAYFAQAAAEAWPGAFPNGEVHVPTSGRAWQKNQYIKNVIRACQALDKKTSEA